MTWTFTLPIPTPSLNEIQGHHWARIREKKREIAQALMIAICEAKPRPTQATGRRRLTIVRYAWNPLDKDNLYGGAKGLVDAIKARGLILDDRDECLDLQVSQVCDRKGPSRTVCTLEEVAA